MAGPSEPLIITLDDIMHNYNHSLTHVRNQHCKAETILITWQLDMDVKGQGTRRFFVGVAVCFTEQSADELEDLASQLCPQKAQLIYAFVPAFDYGSSDFGIYIAQNGEGENLVNGLVNEVIAQAAIEQAVIDASQAHK